MKFENQLSIGTGVYTISELAHILNLNNSKVNRWVSSYWDGEFGKRFEQNYSWSVEDTKAVSFHTLVELYILIQLGEAGISTRAIVNAHKELSEIYQTAFPFAKKEIIDSIKVDGKKVYLDVNGNTISLDGTRQFNLKFVREFLNNLEFGDDELAKRFWPRGKDKCIIVDPRRQLGHPVLGETNIYPETIFSLYTAGETIPFIAFTYEISEQYVSDAIEYCSGLKAA